MSATSAYLTTTSSLSKWLSAGIVSTAGKVVSEKLTAWVVKTPQRQDTAYGPQCTHLGCAYHWDDAKSSSSALPQLAVLIDGAVTYGPAPRPLDQYENQTRRQQTPGGQPPQAGRDWVYEAPIRDHRRWLEHRTGIHTAPPPGTL